MKDFQFYLPKKGDWHNAKFLRFLEPKESHIHLVQDHLRGSRMQMVCNKGACPICNYLAERKNLYVRFLIFCQDIVWSFRRLCKR